MGCFWWPDCRSKSGGKHHYRGMWLDGKMQGKGEFTHADTMDCYKGYFANNFYAYVSKGLTHFLNPFDTALQHKNYIAKSKASITFNKKVEEEKNETISIHRIGNLTEFNDALAQVKEAGRTPMILTSA